MNILLCSDLHVNDNPQTEYRWAFLEKQLPKLTYENNVSQIWILGDTFDRKDRHSGVLVNRFIRAIYSLPTAPQVFILQGNHDASVSQQAFWEFLNSESILYITKPLRTVDGILALPFSTNPLVEWKDLDLSSAKCLFLHQTVAGALIEGNRKIDNDVNPMPILPRGVPIYSGDVHRPQRCGQIEYVGCPYPTRFGENWGGRVLIVNTNNFKDYKEIKLDCIQRAIVDLTQKDIQEFSDGFKPKDQVRVRFHLSTNDLANWPNHEAFIKEVAEIAEIELLSIEAVLEEIVSSEGKEIATTQTLELFSPEETLRLFGEEEKIPMELMEVGFELLRRSNS